MQIIEKICISCEKFRNEKYIRMYIFVTIRKIDEQKNIGSDELKNSVITSKY